MSKIVLPSISAITNEHQGKLKLPGVNQIMPDYPPRSASLPTLSSSYNTGLYTPISSASPSPMSAVHNRSNRSVSEVVGFDPNQQNVSVFLPPSPQYQYVHLNQNAGFSQMNHMSQMSHVNQINQMNSQMICQLQSSVPVQLQASKPVSKQASAWSAKDDERLRILKGERKLGWREVAQYFPSRTANACQFRWRRLVSASKSSTRKSVGTKPKFEVRKSSVDYLLNC